MRLSETSNPIPRGTVFRFPSNLDGWGETLDLMMYLHNEVQLGLVVTSGPRAGHVVCYLPSDALLPNTAMVSTRWLQENWTKWVWPETPVSEVEVVPKATRSELVEQMEPDLVADVALYDSASGGRPGPVFSGYGCPCMVSKVEPLVGYDCFMQIGTHPMYPGETRRIGLVFLTSKGAEVMRNAGRFFLWEGKFIGEAVLAEPPG